MQISSKLDGGNIRVLGISGDETATLEIEADPGTDYMHWFHFECFATGGRERRFRIVNAGQSRTADGWRGYRAMASYDRKTWFRLPTSFDGATLEFTLVPRHPSMLIGHFAPYTLERHRRLLARCQASPEVALECLGRSVEGRLITAVRVGAAARGTPVVWITAGQHPGEPMGCWTAEGFLERLLDPCDGLAGRLRREAVFVVVPTANPDGSVAGRLRTNAAGVDLNRAWADPDPASAPEVLAIRHRMEQTGVSLHIDLHGDETLPYNFVVPSDSVPSVSPRLIALRHLFERRLAEADPDFQTLHGYPPEAPGSADLAIGANWVEETFGCLAVTLEQPFKDLADKPLDEGGWSPGCCRRLGMSLLDAVAAVLRH